MQKIANIIQIAFVVLLFVSSAHSQTKAEHFSSGLEFQKTGEYDNAIEEFEKAIRKDRKFADAYYQIALCYSAQDSIKSWINGRRKARIAFEDAVRFDSTNKQYLEALADFQKRLKYFRDSRVTYDKILDIDPTDINILHKLSDGYIKQFTDNTFRVETASNISLIDSNLLSYIPDEDLQWFIKNAQKKIYDPLVDVKQEKPEQLNIWGNVSNLQSQYTNYAFEYLDKAFETNERILILDPVNKDALFRKGILMYDRGDLDSFIETFKNIVSLYSDEKDAQLFLGMGYAEKGEHEISNIYYEKAVTLMEPDEREMFENVDFIHTDFELNKWRDTQTTQGADTTQFWQSRDPLFMTNFNERRLEHYGRFAEANLRFSVRDKNIPGWKTDRGRTWIKYGQPLKIVDFRDSDGSMYKYDYQIWTYKDFSFVFTNMMNVVTNILELQNWFGLNFKELESQIAEKYPDYYEYKPRGNMFNFPVDIVQFRGNEDKTDVMVYYSSRLKDIELAPDPAEQGELTGSLKHGVFLFDKEWDKIEEHIDTMPLKFNETTAESVPDHFFTLDRVLELDEGEYNLAVELVDPESGNTGTFRDSLIVASFTGEELKISDILIADNIRLTQPEALPSRDNLDILANPYHRFAKTQPVYFYFEIYNLFAANEQAQSRYRMEYSLFPINEKQNIFSRLYAERLHENGGLYLMPFQIHLSILNNCPNWSFF